MLTVSEALQRARLDQGIDLATVAARTKIKARYLQAIEAGDAKSLPGGFFYKSFAHQYATFLGVDTAAIDAEIDRVLGADAPPPLPRAAQQTAAEQLSRSRAASKYFSYAALLLILVACYEIDGWWHGSGAPVGENTSCGERQAPPPSGFHSLPFPRFQPGLPRLRRLLRWRGKTSQRLVPESSWL